MVHVAREMEREGFTAAAADRRRHDQRQAHGGQDRAGVSRTGDPRQGCVAQRRRRRAADAAGAARAARPRQPRHAGTRSARRSASGGSASWSPTPRRQRRVSPSTGQATTIARAGASWARRVLDDFPLAEIVPYIDWSPFFMAWELPGKYPQILTIRRSARRPANSSTTPRSCCDDIIDEQLLTATRLYGFFPANSDGDDIVVWTDESRNQERAAFPHAAAAVGARGPDVFRSLADYLAPVSTSVADYLGAFAVTAGVGADELVERFKTDHDDYNAIMAKALADRLAEAFAELLHERLAREWGFGRDEHLSKDELIEEKYRGIRPARRAIRRARTTRRRRRCGNCWTWKRRPAFS